MLAMNTRLHRYCCPGWMLNAVGMSGCTPAPFTFLWLAVILAFPAVSARAGIWIEPVVEDSPMIKKGHLEGGINGEAAHRSDGKTPLMLAVEADQNDVVDYLLGKGADLSLKDAAGETAMDIARKGKYPDIAAKLDAYVTAHPNGAEYYASKTPTLFIVSGTDQTGAPDSDAPQSLMVYAMGKDGQALADAPVKFSVEDGTLHLLTDASSPPSASLVLRTDDSGICRANVHLPKTPDTVVRIMVSAGVGAAVSTVEFTATSKVVPRSVGTGVVSCFSPTDQAAVLNGDGSVDVSWENRTDDETCIKIWIRVPGAWKLALTVPAHSTSAHIPPQ